MRTAEADAKKHKKDDDIMSPNVNFNPTCLHVMYVYRDLELEKVGQGGSYRASKA